MSSMRLVIFCGCALLVLSSLAHAQETMWNRKVEEVAITPSPTGGAYDLKIFAEVLVSNPGTALDLSFSAETYVNGSLIAPPNEWVVRSLEPTGSCSLNCGSDCGQLFVDGVFNTMTCHEDDPNDCSCGHWLTADIPGMALQPGDEIMVILFPSPGAVPEDDTSDDTWLQTFNGQGTGWNRRVAGLSMEPSPTTQSAFDVTALIDISAGNTTADLLMSTTVELFVNSTPGGLPITFDIQLNGPTGDCEFDCGSSCGGLYVDGMLNTMTCRLDGPGDCDCGYWIQANFPGVSLTPGDEIMVLLRPAPGAIPDTDESDDIMMHSFTGQSIGWGRSFQAVPIVPTGSTGDQFFDIMVMADMNGSGAGGPLDQSTELELLVNGVPTGNIISWSLLLNGPAIDCEFSCGSDCGPLYIDGVFNTMLCRHQDPTDCECGYWLTGLFPGVELQPEDEIMVLLRPAPGAAPDPGENGDGERYIEIFDGTPSGWNRSINSVELVETAPGVFDVSVDGAVALARAMAFQDLSFDVEVMVDGTVVAMQSLTMQYEPSPTADTCQADCNGGSCGLFLTGEGNFVPGECLIWPGFEGCSCGTGWSLVFPNIAVPPEGVPEVHLRPVPGALPELPGFEEDDEARPEDPTSVDDTPGSAFGRLLAQNHPNPFNPQTTIAFRVPAAGPVVLEIFDTRGTVVHRLVDETLAAGNHTVQWNGSDAQGQRVASGHYFYRLSVDGRSETLKMTLLK